MFSKPVASYDGNIIQAYARKIKKNDLLLELGNFVLRYFNNELSRNEYQGVSVYRFACFAFFLFFERLFRFK